MSDEIETIDRNPKSWAAWKREAERLQKIIDGMALAAMDSSESVELPLDYLQGHKDGLEWAAKLAEANHPETGDWLYNDPIELAKAIRKGPDMPPAQPAADSEQDRNPVLAYADSYRDMAKQGVESVPIRSVITDIERNIAPLYRHAQPVPVAPEENHIGSKNALDAIVSFIKSKSNPTVKCYEGVSEQLFKDNCHGIHSHVIEYILKLGEELEDLRAEQAEMQPAPVVPDGYVMVPKEMTDEIGEAIAMQANCCGGIALDIYDAMLAAAPQEVKGE